MIDDWFPHFSEFVANILEIQEAISVGSILSPIELDHTLMVHELVSNLNNNFGKKA